MQPGGDLRNGRRQRQQAAANLPTRRGRGSMSVAKRPYYYLLVESVERSPAAAAGKGGGK